MSAAIPSVGAERDLVLLTGASGVLGSALLIELADLELAVLRHRRALKSEFSPALEVHGSLTEPRFGLSAGDWDRLAARTRAIVHCGSVTSFSEPASAIDAVNVGGTRNVLALAERAAAPLCYVSTAFVDHAQEGYPGLARYDEVSPGREAYLHSKREAERVVRGYARTLIVRPSVLLGDSRTGWIARRQGLHRILRAFCSGMVGFVPVAETTLIDFLPQDLVAAAIGAALRGSLDEAAGQRSAGTERAPGAAGSEHQPSSGAGELWLTAGANALTAGEIFGLCLAEAAAAGIELDTPRFFDTEIIERLLIPAFLEEVSEGERRRYANMFATVQVFTTTQRFPSSLPIAGHPDLLPTATMLEEALGATIRRYCLPRRRSAQAAAVERAR